MSAVRSVEGVTCTTLYRTVLLFLLQVGSCFFYRKKLLNSEFAIIKDCIWFTEKTFFQITLLGCHHCLLT